MGLLYKKTGVLTTTFFMKTIICSEQDIEAFKNKLPNVIMVHFKIVGVGPNTLGQASHDGDKLCKIVREQPGFFVLSHDGLDLREAMHDIVDRFCNTQEGQV